MRILAAVSLLLLVGLLLEASMLVYAAYVLGGTLWVSRYLSQRWTDGLQAQRRVSAREIEIGDVLEVTIRLDNRGKLPIPWLILEDLLPASAIHAPPPALKVDGQAIRVCRLGGRSGRLLSYKLTGLRRGYFQLGPAIVETGDLFGLHRRFRALTEPSYLLVLPRLIPLVGYDVASRRPMGEVRVTYRLMEDPLLISGIRQYQPGDPLRSIHWRATARTGQLQSKQYQPTSVAGATLVLDFHCDSNPNHHEPVRTDLAATAAASICHTLMNLQLQFGLISNGRDAVDRIAESGQVREFRSLAAARQSSGMRESSERLKPVVLPTQRGVEHFMRIHRTLGRLERTDGLRLEELLIECESRLPRDATVLVLLQEVDESAAVALGMLRRRGFSLSAIVNNYENEAYTVALSRLMAQGISVHHLSDEASVAEICKQFVYESCR